MRGCTFILNNQSVHTGNDLDLVQEVKSIDYPEVQSYSVEVPGRDGLVFLTKGLTGRVNYFNRPIELVYFASGSRADLIAIERAFGKYHGEVIKIIDDDTPSYYYEGEAMISPKWTKNYLQITVKIDAKPFMYKVQHFERIVALTSSEQTVTIVNNGFEVNPTFTLTGSATIKKGSVTVIADSSGSWTDSDILISPGSNTITVSGSGSLSITYREAVI